MDEDGMDEFYETVIPDTVSDDGKSIRRQAFAGLLWRKQFYHYVVQQWIEGDETMPPPPDERKNGRNHQWPHLFNRVIKQDRPV
jgi:hypothetical protein